MFCDNYKWGIHRKWDIDPHNNILEESILKLELLWKNLDNDFVDKQQPTLHKGPPRKIQKATKAREWMVCNLNCNSL